MPRLHTASRPSHHQIAYFSPFRQESEEQEIGNELGVLFSGRSKSTSFFGSRLFPKPARNITHHATRVATHKRKKRRAEATIELLASTTINYLQRQIPEGHRWGFGVKKSLSMMPSLRRFRASAGEEAAAATPVAATVCSSAEGQPKTVGVGAVTGAPACDLPSAVPLGAVSLGATIGDLVSGDRKRPALEDYCMEAPPASVFSDSARPVGDATTTSTSAPAVTSVSAAAFAAGIADHQSYLPSRAAAGIRRGPPKKRICSDLASAAEVSALASAPSAEAVAAAAAASAHGVLLSNNGATRNYLVDSTSGTTADPPVQWRIQQQSSLQLAPSSIAGASMNYWPSGRLDSLGFPSMITAEHAIAGVPLPISSSTTSLAPHLLLLQRERQLMGYPANIHDNNMLGMSAVRGLSTAAALAEIEAHELALARARAHHDIVSMAMLDYHARPMSYQGQAGLVGLLPAEAQTEVANKGPRTDVPATTVSQEQSLANTPSTDLHNGSVRPKESRCDGPSLPIGGETSDAQATLLGKADSIMADKPPPATASRKKVPAKKKTKKKKGGSSTVGAIVPVPKHTPRDKRPRIAATLSIFPETNTNSMLLSHPDDGDLLSPYLCIIRKQIEVFVATHKDIEAKLAVGGNKVPPQAGQIGLRCIHCKHVPFRDRAKSSESYPNLLKNIHQSVRNYQRHHWPKCKEIPDKVRKDVDACLGDKVSKSKGTAGQWWIRSCRDRGLFDAEEVEFLDESKKGGIYLVDVDANVVLEPQASSTEEEGETTTKQGSRSPISIPTPSASTSRSGLDVLLAATGIADTCRPGTLSTVSVPTAAPHTESDDVRPIQSSSTVDDVAVPSATPSTGVAESLPHECTQPTCRPTCSIPQSVQALAPDTHIHSKVWFTKNLVRMLSGISNREIIDLEGANIVVRQSSRLQRELLPVYFGMNFSLTTFETLLTSLGFHLSSCRDDRKIFSLTEANADIVKILTGQAQVKKATS